MSIQKMDEAIAASALGPGDQKWWPFWMREFAKSTGQGHAIQITFTVDSVITFLRTLRDSGKPAFVRLQVVRSLIFYQMEVLHASDPDLTGIRAKLAMLSRDEPNTKERAKTADEKSSAVILEGQASTERNSVSWTAPLFRFDQ